MDAKSKTTETKAKAWWRRVKPRGQNMVEYSLVSHALLIGGGAALLPVVARLLEALDIYYQGIYFVLETGAV